ncbi:MAG: hypothetical protein Ct9H300mP9_2890 [Candidatus Neomarinimicrobiota bacterium]|nr:MAG: hypothetical protein Ct9H300mP9_2890 [Candidatus Neomarinimicrobiota bacterium]
MHNLNGSVTTAYKGWGLNTIFQYGSGYPYTPVITNYEQQGEVLSNVLLRNSRRKPAHSGWMSNSLKILK